MNNKDLLNEGFFRKKTYADKAASKYGSYTPADKKTTGMEGFGAVDEKNTDELKRRLTGTLGAVMGNNTLKNMASKAIKTFPIIVSENVDPSTVVLLKNYLEVQYAEYLNLLISNQTIDITSYDRSGENGNIAVQALDQITGTDFTRQRVANRALTGKLTADDVFKNNSLYTLIRQESVHTGDEGLDFLLENAIVVDAKNTDKITNMLLEADLSQTLNEDTAVFAQLHATFLRILINNRTLAAGTTVIPDNRTFTNVAGYTHVRRYTNLKGYEALVTLDNAANIRITYNTNGVADEHPARTSSDYRRLYRDLVGRDPHNRDNIERDKDIVRSSSSTDPDDIVGLYNQSYTTTSHGSASQQTAWIHPSSGNTVHANSIALTNLVAYDRSTSDEAKKDLVKRGYVATDASGFEHFNRLTNTNVVVDPVMLDSALNKSVGDLLANPKNDFLRDRFEKATYLLQSRKISGLEYYNYITQRLGLPVRQKILKELIHSFPAKEVESSNSDSDSAHVRRNNRLSQNALKNNEREVYKIATDICSTKAGDVLKYSAVGAGIGGAAGGAAVAISAASSAVLWPLLPVTVGAGIIAGVIAGLTKKRHSYLQKVSEKMEGWERVEQLINDMDDNTYRLAVDFRVSQMRHSQQNIEAEAQAQYNSKYRLLKNEDDAEVSDAVLIKSINDYKNKMANIYTEAVAYGTELEKFEPLCETAINFNKEFTEQLCEAANIPMETLVEKINRINMSGANPYDKLRKQMPVTSIKYDTKTDLMVPSFATKNVLAYGSVEYDRRDMNSRKFNTPLILTVKFKERYSDGTYADSELTATIGVLGIVTRVPSEEMEYILSSNAQGITLKGIFTGDQHGTIGDLIANYKAKNVDYSKLPQSADTWKNLEKIMNLAVANKMAGKSNNNVANAHIIFSQKEIDSVRQTTGVDYLRDKKSSAALMKRYSAMNLIVANDSLERAFTFDSIDSASWDVMPYDAIRGRDTSDQLSAALSKLNTLR